MKLTLDEYLKLEYIVNIIPEECTDGTLCYRAEYPQLSGCMSHGFTPEEALINAIEAKRLYIETLLEKGLDVPFPVLPTGDTFSSYQSITTVVIPEEVEEKTSIGLPLAFDMPKEISKSV
jgi:predicted RNase H-like HicB family nuclease